MIMRNKIPHLLSENDVAKILRMSPQDTHRFISKGRQEGILRAILLEGQLRIDADSLKDLLQQRLDQPLDWRSIGWRK